MAVSPPRATNSWLAAGGGVELGGALPPPPPPPPQAEKPTTTSTASQRVALRTFIFTLPNRKNIRGPGEWSIALVCGDKGRVCFSPIRTQCSLSTQSRHCKTQGYEPIRAQQEQRNGVLRTDVQPE